MYLEHEGPNEVMGFTLAPPPRLSYLAQKNDEDQDKGIEESTEEEAGTTTHVSKWRIFCFYSY